MEKGACHLKNILILGSILGFFAVGIGAFGTHALKDILGERISIFETGNRYHFYHTFALFVSAFIYSKYLKKEFLYSSYLFALGILFFSGSLYALSISGLRILGAITPIGGVLFLGGWVTLCYSLIRLQE